MVGAATVALDDQNSLSSYADDFPDDESVIPPAQHTKTAPPSSGNPSTSTAADSSGGGDASAQQGEGARTHDSRAAGAPASSREASSESNTDESNRSSGGREGSGQRRQSESKKHSGANTVDDVAVLNASETEARGDDVGRGAEFRGDCVSPSASVLKDRLREADLENARLRGALEKSETANPGGSDDDRRELEILKGQVEAAK